MKATFDEKTGNLKDLTITSTKDNAITLDNTKFTGTRINTSTNEDQGDMGIQGGAVTLKNGTEVSAGGTVTILAAKSFEDGKTIEVKRYGETEWKSLYYVKDYPIYVWAILAPYGDDLEDDYESD